jgi:hypothetical protein
MSNLILELFLHNLKLCIDYQHWIHNYNKTIKQFYINTNKTCVLNPIWGVGPQPMGRFFVIHTLPWSHLHSTLL